MLSIAAGVAALFVAGFVYAWVGARTDKGACQQLPMPPDAAQVRVANDANGHECVWVDDHGNIVEETPVP